MSLHSIIEPAGTLMTGWKLVPKRDCHAADTRNEDDIPLEVASAPAPAENEAPVEPASKWESERNLGKVG
jgi:hypothetical protein